MRHRQRAPATIQPGILIGLDALSTIIETVMYSGYLHDTIPLSIVLVGPSGSGKSKLLLAYRRNAGIHTTDDLTSAGLFDILKNDERDGAIKHLLIGDFNKIVAHKKHVATSTMGSLLSVLADGTSRIDDGRREKTLDHAPVGLLTAMTKSVYEDHEKEWKDKGISRRVLPFFFGYTPATKMRVSAEIRNGNVSLEHIQPRMLALPVLKGRVNIPDAIAREIENFGLLLADAQAWSPKWFWGGGKAGQVGVTLMCRPTKGETPLPFTPQLVLRTLARAHALRDKRRVVSRQDVQFLLELMEYCNYETPKQV